MTIKQLHGKVPLEELLVRKHAVLYGKRKLISVFTEVPLDLISWSGNAVSFVELKFPVPYSQNPATRPCLEHLNPLYTPSVFI